MDIEGEIQKRINNDEQALMSIAKYEANDEQIPAAQKKLIEKNKDKFKDF